MSDTLTMTATEMPAPGLWATLKEDLACVFQRDPADRTVVGVPGRIVDTRAGSTRPANGISLDHNLLPDPVAKSIACLIERIESLEKELAILRQEPPPPDHSAACQTCSAGDLCCEQEITH